MYFISNTKNLFVLTAALFIFSGCSGGGSTPGSVSTGNTSPSISDGDISTSILTTRVTLKGKVKDKDTGKGLGNVKVSIDESTTTTDAEGYYELTDLHETDREIVTFESDGYQDYSAITAINEPLGDNSTSSNYLEVSMDRYNSKADYMTQSDIIIDAPNGTTVSIPSSTEYMDDKGKIYDGSITITMSYIDVTTETGREMFPGEYEGKTSSGSIVLFVSYGAVSVEIENDSDEKLDLSGTATITFPSLGLIKQDIIPLWYYNYSEGLWIEEGYAELQEDGTYKGEISHLGTWGLNKPVEEATSIYRSPIVDENGDPATTVKVYAIGKNWIRTDLSTDEDGIFEIEVIPGNTFKLKAYDYTEKYEAVYAGTLPAIASGEISSEI